MENIDWNMPNNDFSDMQAPFFSHRVSGSKRFYRPLHGDGEGLQVLAGGREQCGPSYLVEREDFPYFALEFIASGRGELLLDGEAYELDPGTVFLYSPNQQHRISNPHQREMLKFFVTFTGSSCFSLLEEKLQLLGRVLHVPKPGGVLSTFEDLIDTGLGHGKYSQDICRFSLELLLYKIADSALEPEEGRSPAYHTYRRCRDILEEHALFITSLSQAAERCSVDPAYLCRLFKRFDRQSPYQFLQRIRILSAADRLSREGSPLKELARDLGYSDQFHFSRAFKQVMGISPRRFGKGNRR